MAARASTQLSDLGLERLSVESASSGVRVCSVVARDDRPVPQRAVFSTPRLSTDREWDTGIGRGGGREGWRRGT